MALSTKWTRLQIRDAARRELIDPNARWWSDAELNEYISDWQDAVQQELELVWGSATTTVGSSTATVTVTSISTDILRMDAVYWDNIRKTPRSKNELDVLQRDWRAADATEDPDVIYDDDTRTLSFWPPPSASGVVVCEYPKRLTFGTDTSTMGLPAWARYSARPYCAYRAYLRQGPNHDLQRAGRYKAKFLRDLRRFRTIKANILPDRHPTLRPTWAEDYYEIDILNPQARKQLR